MVVFQSFSSHSRSQSPLAYSDFMAQVKDGNVGSATIDGQVIRCEMKGGTPFVSISPETDNSAMVGALLDNKVKLSGSVPNETPLMRQPLFNALPLLFLIAWWVYFLRQIQA